MKICCARKTYKDIQEGHSLSHAFDIQKPFRSKGKLIFFCCSVIRRSNALQQTHHEGIRIGIVVKKLGKAMNWAIILLKKPIQTND
jgi:hypothetical protein